MEQKVLGTPVKKVRNKNFCMRHLYRKTLASNRRYILLFLQISLLELHKMIFLAVFSANTISVEGQEEEESGALSVEHS